MSGGRGDSSLAAVLLSQRLVEAGGAPLKASEYWALLGQVGDPGALLGQDAAALSSVHGIEPALADRVAALLDSATALAFELDRLEQSGVRVVASVDDEYPDALLRLGPSAPPLLYAAGDVGLLQATLLGVVGSRDVGPEAAEVAKAAAAEAVRHGMGVVSGGAKGVDRLAMNGAVDAGGAAVGMLADSLLRTTRDPDVRRLITDGSVCLCTPYKPSAGFTVANAMGRNKLIYALSAATLVVSSDMEKGGTWAGAVEALRLDLSPVVVWVGDGSPAGNRRLADRGAVGVESVEELFPLPERAGPVVREAEPEAQQIALGL